MVDLGAYIAAGFKALLVKLMQDAASYGFKALTAQPNNEPQLKFDEYLERTFQRCTTTHFYDRNGVTDFMSKAMECYDELDVKRGDAWIKEYARLQKRSGKFETGDLLFEQNLQSENVRGTKKNDGGLLSPTNSLKVFENGKWQVSRTHVEAIEDWFKGTGDHKFLIEQLSLIAKCAKYVENRRKERDDSFESILKELVT